MTFMCLPTPLAPATPIPNGFNENTPGHFCPDGDGILTFGPTCCVSFEYDAAGSNQPFFEFLIQFTDSLGNPQAIAGLQDFGLPGGAGPSPRASGSSGSANVGGTTVTVTVLGPSNNLFIPAQSGVTIGRYQDGDGLAAGIKFCFSPPAQDISIRYNEPVNSSCPVGLQNFQQSAPVDVIPNPANAKDC